MCPQSARNSERTRAGTWAEYDRSVSAPAQVPTRVRAEFLADCGHIPTWDDPQRVAEVILATAARAAQDAEVQRSA